MWLIEKLLLLLSSGNWRTHNGHTMRTGHRLLRFSLLCWCGCNCVQRVNVLPLLLSVLDIASVQWLTVDDHLIIKLITIISLCRCCCCCSFEFACSQIDHPILGIGFDFECECEFNYSHNEYASGINNSTDCWFPIIPNRRAGEEEEEAVRFVFRLWLIDFWLIS